MIKDLIEKQICFAVVVSYSYLTKYKYYENQQWEIIAHERDSKKLKGLGFFKHNNPHNLNLSQQNPEGIISKVLDSETLYEFRSILPEHFEKVCETKEGKVYELKDWSFKEYRKKYRHG